MSNKTLIIVIVLLLLLFGGGVFYFHSQDKTITGSGQMQDANQSSATTSPLTDNSTQGQPAQATSSIANSTISATGDCKRDFDQNVFNTAKVNTQNQTVQMTFKDYGIVQIALDDKDAPKTVENFLKLVNAGFYDCLTIHRVSAGFVIQGGDPSGDGTGGPGYTVPAEIKLLHKRGSIAMARLGDQVNPSKASSGSQFYIALQDLPQLDAQYTVFGNVVTGMDIVDKIGALPTNPPGDGAPTTPVVIQKAFIVTK